MRDGLYILVVEDDPDLREMLAMLLPVIWPGATVSTAASAAEARLRLDRTIDLMLVDDELGPGEDGPTFLAAIREYAPPTVGMVTADESAARWRRLNVARLWKPFECYDLKAAVDRVLRPELVGLAT